MLKDLDILPDELIYLYRDSIDEINDPHSPDKQVTLPVTWDLGDETRVIESAEETGNTIKIYSTPTLIEGYEWGEEGPLVRENTLVGFTLAEKVRPDVEEITLEVGETKTITNIVEPEGGHFYHYWEYGDTEGNVTKEKIDEGVKITGKLPGSTSIEAEYVIMKYGHMEALDAETKVKYTIPITVVEPKIDTIKLSPQTKTVKEGETYKITATTSPAGVSGELEWYSTNEEVATVTSTGKTGTVVAIKEGNADIGCRLKDDILVGGVSSVIVEKEEIENPDTGE